MKRFISVDDGSKWALIGAMICLLIPLIGPVLFGTRFTSLYYETRKTGAMLCVASFLCHLGVVIYLLILYF